MPAQRPLPPSLDIASGSVLDPRPISESLKRHIDQAVLDIPSSRTGHVGAGISLQGVEVSAAAKWRDLTAGAYAGREWGGNWLAGAKVGWSF